jgi:ATP-binding cassette, subfamily B, bacterial CvaB/MchF/RaxB
VSCFGSIETIQKTLTTGFVQAVVDGLMVCGTLAMMVLYSGSLAAVSIVAMLLYAALRWGVFSALRRATAEEIIHAAKQQTHFLETANGIQSVRLFGRGDQRRAGWMNMLADQFNAGLRVQRIHISHETGQTLLFGIERVLVIWLAARAVLDNSFTVGMLFAYIAYKDQFATRIAALIDKTSEFAMLRLHGERVADIVMSEAEPADPQSSSELGMAKLRPSIELRDVSYRYSPTEPWVLQHIDLHVRAGECLAITGVSGCGKTTLVKIMLGLLAPTQGEVLLDGRPIKGLGLQNYREIIGTVMQEDRLFSGSLADNICFFDPLPNVERIEECARLAAVEDEILEMPMGYNTLVGDIGTGLSGGQKQRILLARALYRKPRILVLDEATSHLDIGNEQHINDAVRAMTLTRVIVAHRRETIEMAERVVTIEQGQIFRDVEPTLSAKAHPAPPSEPSVGRL